MLTHALEKTPLPAFEADGLTVLKRWQEQRAALCVYFAAHNAGAGSVMRAQIADVSRCLVLRNEGTVLRLDLESAQFKYGPLQVLLMPSDFGRAAAISQRPDGILGQNGLNIILDSGHSVFLCESQKAGSDWLAFADTVLGQSRLLDRD
jgi:hypothetical protein